MTWHAFSPHVAIDDTTGVLIQSGSGYVVPLGAPDDATPLPVTDLGGVPFPGSVIPVVDGLVAGFRVEGHTKARWVSGDRHVTIWSPEAMEASAQGAAHAAAGAADHAVAGALAAIDTATQAYLDTEGYAPLRIAQTVADIPPGTRPGVAFLLLEKGTPVAAPVEVGAVSATVSGGPTSLEVPIPAEVEDGDMLVAVLTSQHSPTSPPGDGAWAVPSGWTLDAESVANSGGNSHHRATAIAHRIVTGDEPSTVTFIHGTANQRLAAVLIAVRGADPMSPLVVGDMAGLNGVGTDSTVVPSVTSPTSRGLHLLAGWSNGTAASGQSTSPPDVPAGWGGPLAEAVEPTTPTAGFTTLRVWGRELTASGPTGSVELNWPLLSQRAGVSIVVTPLDGGPVPEERFDPAETNPVVIGVDALSDESTGTFDTVVIGKGAVANNGSTDAIVIGTEARSTDGGAGAVVIGHSARGQNGAATAVGKGAYAGPASVAIGEGSGSDPNEFSANYVAVGREAESGINSVAVGHAAKSTSSSGVTIGVATSNTGPNGVVLGADASNDGASGSAVVVGYGAKAESTASNPIVIGYSARARDGGGIAIGQSAVADGSNAVAIGTFAAEAGANSVALGGAKALPDHAVAIGTAVASGPMGVAVGSSAQAHGEQSVALGVGAGAFYEGSIAIGNAAQATADHQAQIAADELVVAPANSGGSSLVLYSPDGTSWRITVDDTGALHAAEY